MAEDSQIKKILSKIPNPLGLVWFLGEHAFSILMAMILVLFVWGLFVFYSYVYLPKTTPPTVNGASFQFNEQAYRDILVEWQTRDKNLKESLEKEYKSPFLAK